MGLLVSAILAVPSSSAVAYTPAPVVSLSRSVGPPTTSVRVAGSGFGVGEAVDLYFDTTDVGLASTDGTGAFTADIRVPKAALPGRHWISAVGQSNGTSAQESFLVRTNWAQFHFRADHAGRNPYENVLSPSNVGGLGVDWSFTTGGRVSSSPAVANGTLYVGSQNVYALNASTGAVRWSFNAGSGPAPAVAHGIVYVISDRLYALDARTGALRWSVPVDINFHTSPTVTHGVVYFGSGGYVYALDASSGAERWRFSTGAQERTSAPTVANGVLYVGTSLGGSLYALRASTGAKLWRFNTAPSCAAIARSGGVNGAPAVVGRVVYVDTICGIVFALRTSTGAQIWSHVINGSIFTSPAVAKRRVFVGTGLGIFALDATTGAQLWTLRTGARVDSSPAFANGVVYFGAQDGNVYALRASTGETLWSFFTIFNGIFSSPAVANGILYIGSDDHNVYAFRLPAAAHAAARPNPDALISDPSVEN